MISCPVSTLYRDTGVPPVRLAKTFTHIFDQIRVARMAETAMSQLEHLAFSAAAKNGREDL